MHGDVCDDDIDAGGVIDARDACLDGGTGDVVDATGCSVNRLGPCDNGWRNHGACVSCVAHATNGFVAAGLITGAERGVIQSEVGASGCGHWRR